MLFDLIFDPHERRNVIDRPEHVDSANKIRGRLDDWMRETSDPIRNGLIPLPIGGRLTDADDYHPSGGWPDSLRPKQ